MQFFFTRSRRRQSSRDPVCILYSGICCPHCNSASMSSQTRSFSRYKFNNPIFRKSSSSLQSAFLILISQYSQERPCPEEFKVHKFSFTRETGQTFLKFLTDFTSKLPHFEYQLSNLLCPRSN